MSQSQNDSTPTFSQFDPTQIKWQDDAIDDIWEKFDYSSGKHEIIFSGAQGSAKSLCAAHLAVRHCVENKKARLLLGRKALPDLKETIFRTIKLHLEGTFKEGRDYWINESVAKIYFRNGSEIISRSWSDRKYQKMRSLDLSAAIIEEGSENDDEDKQVYDEIAGRVGRLHHVKKPFMLVCTNPDSPQHWLYKHFMMSDNPNRHVYYSVTTDNPFLPSWYVEQRLKDLDPKMAERLVYGRWVEIRTDVIYHSYNRDRNYRPYSYEINPFADIHISWDFNIGEGKPLSLCLFQFIKGQFHVFGEVIIEGADTEESCQELAAKGFLDHADMKYRIHGDATARARSTKNKSSDYDIINKFMANYRTPMGAKIDYVIEVPRENPPVRSRHNIVNAYCQNALIQNNLFVYKDAPTVDEGLRLTSLKKGGSYIEDDSKRYQHVTTALGYGICYVHKETREKPTMKGTQIR